MMQGRRIDNDEDKLGEPGDYWYSKSEEIWQGNTPNGMRVNLRKHEVVENEDGTITVSPSILAWQDRASGRREWHGYLENGIWREA